jgi:hypothetical protein
MRKVNRKRRREEVATTGSIPSGTQVHFRRLRNPSISQIRFNLRKTQEELESGTCHPTWGAKQLEALNQMLEAKLDKFAKKRLGMHRDS